MYTLRNYETTLENPLTMLTLLFFLPLWNVNSCAVIKKEQLSDIDDIREWLRRITFPTPPPIRDRFTFSWERYTISPYEDIVTTPNNDTNMKLAIFLPIVFVCLISFLCKYLLCGKSDDSTDAPTRILHPPPRRAVPPAQSSRPAQGRDPVPVSVLRTELFTTATNRNFRPVTNTVSNRTDVPDQPPGYSDVVIADLMGGQVTFPEVKPTVPETPPPSYEEGNIRKY